MQTVEQTGVTPIRIVEDLWAARASQVIVAGVELDIFTHIASGMRTPKEIARAAKADERGLTRLLDALVGLGYLNKRGDRYGLEPVAERFLVRGAETYIGDTAYETKLTWPAWGNLAEVIRTGRPLSTVDQEEGGREFFPTLVSAIFPMSYAAARAAVASLKERQRRQIKSVLDVAAGSAAWSLAFAQAIPEAEVTVLDYPEVTAVAKGYVERFGVGDRYHYVEGNLREQDFGRNRYDLVILGHIIHSEGEKWGRKLIKKSLRALKDGGMLLIADIMPNDTRTGPPMSLLFGLNMLVHTEGGGVFTYREYREWLKGAGFKKVSQIEVPGPSPLVLAVK